MMQPTSERAEAIRDALTSEGRIVASELLPIVYEELRSIATRLLGGSDPSDTLQPTALVHEAYMRLIGNSRPNWDGRAHFLAVAARAMRQIIIDYARRRRAEKRGRNWRRISLDHAMSPIEASDLDMLALDEALTRLASLNERQCRIVEMRFLAGLTVAETAAVLGVSTRTVKLDWRMARAWLNRTLKEGDHK